MVYEWQTACEVCEGLPENGDIFIRVTNYAVTGKSGWLKLGTNSYYCERCWNSQDVEQELS